MFWWSDIGVLYWLNESSALEPAPLLRQVEGFLSHSASWKGVEYFAPPPTCGTYNDLVDTESLNLPYDSNLKDKDLHLTSATVNHRHIRHESTIGCRYGTRKRKC